MPKSPPSSSKPDSAAKTSVRSAPESRAERVVKETTAKAPVAASSDTAAPLDAPRKVTLPDREQSIRERAFAIWEHEGRPDGQAERHWRMAEQAITKIEEAAVSVDAAGVPLTEKQTDESFDVGRSPYAPPEPGPV